MQTMRLVLAGWLVLTVVVACNSDADADAGPTPQSACASLLSGQASYRERCGGGAVLASAADATAACENVLSARGVSGAARRQAAACGDKYRSLPCDQHTYTAECGVQAPGTLPDGATCGMGGQCASGTCRGISHVGPGTVTKHVGDDGSVHPCGTCVAAATVGAKCLDFEPACPFDSVCDRTTNTCVASAKLGEACNEALSCATSLNCVAGRCVAQKPRGGDCTTRYDCAGVQACTGGKCSAPVKVGELCTGGDPCEGTARCVVPSGAEFRCVATKAPGQPCATNTECAFACTGGVCTSPYVHQGQACSTQAQDGPYCDESAECVGGKCQPIAICQ